MPSSVFAKGDCAKDQKHGGSFCADNVILTWTGGGATEGALVQQAQWTCQRTVNMLYEIGSTAVYYVGNRRQGTANFARVVSGSTTFKGLVEDFGDICNPEDLVIDASQAAFGDATAVQAGGVQYTLKDATLTSVGGSVTAQDVVVNEQLGFMFVDLLYV